MPGITSKRESIVEYIRTTTIPLINGAGNYWNTIKTVTRNMQSPDKFNTNELPAVIITSDIPVSYSPMTAEEFVTGSIERLDDGFGIGLLAIASVQRDSATRKTGVVDQANNKLFSDLLIAMNIDVTLNGNCEYIMMISSRNSLDWVGEGLAVVFQHYKANYRFKPGATVPVT